MGKSYSQDLRMKVLQALDKGMSKMAAHRTFGISRTPIDDGLHLREATGAVAPKKAPGGAPSIADLAAFETFAARHSSCTLDQMSQAWEQETGRPLSRNTFSLALRKIGWTRKKRVCSTENAT